MFQETGKITPFHYTPSLLSKFFNIHIPRQLSLFVLVFIVNYSFPMNCALYHSETNYVDSKVSCLVFTFSGSPGMAIYTV